MIQDGREGNLPWMVTEEKVTEAVRAIAQAAHPRRIILFGSFVHGRVGRDSDLDVLVVTSVEPESRRRESVRIRAALDHIRMPVDILVVSERSLNEQAENPGLIYREILRSGKVVYDSAA